MYGSPVGTIVITSAGGYLTQHINNTTGEVSYNPTRIFHLSLTSGTTASVLQITNGQGGTVIINEKGTAAQGTEFDYGFHGKTFPSGAYVVTDANFINGSVDCRSDKF